MRIERRLWTLFERIHAITYFAPECLAAAREAGYRGFFMGYFAMRAAPLGPVGPAVVTASFFGFPPALVQRALPDAWGYAPPEKALEARLAGAYRVLDRVWNPKEDASSIGELADLLWDAAQAAATAGRVLAAANQALPRPDEPSLALWQAATTLREQRGDGHVAALVSAGVSPVESMVVRTAAGGIDSDAMRRRAGSPEAWAAAEESLRSRGWLDDEGRLTDEGRNARQDIEDRTDDAASSPWAALGQRWTERAAELLHPLVDRLVVDNTVPAVNPIGLPLPARG